MKKQVAVVTGTSSGVGLALSEALAQSGWKVYATMRNLDRGEAVRDLQDKGLDIECLQLDVQLQESVDHAIAAIMKREETIDLLVNNAGIGYIRTTEQATEEAYKNVFDINVFGVIRCTKAVLPHMRERKQGRVVTISSIGGLVGQPFNEIYCATKFAVEGYFESLATYVTPEFGIEFMIVEPAGISSAFANHVMKQVSESGGFYKDEYEPLLNAYLGSREHFPPEIMQTSEQVAEVVVKQLSAHPLPLRMRTSAWAEDFCRYKTASDPTGLIQTKEVQQLMLRK
ncbi:SDR family oxidoreductase [Hazenella sp. IB182353]|uniref:SDR family oxidoreductase n=1 Tax=Polycladospora coralii TaxID=2771432 RepID=UPI0017474F70|nr:SDR family oxidoreductase [Polycladospora coralii]MBS7530557.1 SDR family oxidoreductase [Polycladospora coralii]